MNDISILNLMIKDHNSLMQNLKDIEENVNKDKSYITRSFNNFKWNLEKHFFVEERAIFTFYNPEKIDEGYNTFLKLTKEHTKILAKVKEVEKKIKEQNEIDFEELKDLLINHKTLEENKMYPILDEEIAEGEKRFIIQRIKDIKI